MTRAARGSRKWASMSMCRASDAARARSISGETASPAAAHARARVALIARPGSASARALLAQVVRALALAGIDAAIAPDASRDGRCGGARRVRRSARARDRGRAAGRAAEVDRVGRGGRAGRNRRQRRGEACALERAQARRARLREGPGATEVDMSRFARHIATAGAVRRAFSGHSLGRLGAGIEQSAAGRDERGRDPQGTVSELPADARGGSGERRRDRAGCVRVPVDARHLQRLPARRLRLLGPGAIRPKSSAMASFPCAAREAHILNVCVAPEEQRRGTASAS